MPEQWTAGVGTGLAGKGIGHASFKTLQFCRVSRTFSLPRRKEALMCQSMQISYVASSYVLTLTAKNRRADFNPRSRVAGCAELQDRPDTLLTTESRARHALRRQLGLCLEWPCRTGWAQERSSARRGGNGGTAVGAERPVPAMARGPGQWLAPAPHW